MYGREDGARDSFRTIAILMAIPLFGLAVFLIWQWVGRQVPPSAERAAAPPTSQRKAIAVSPPSKAPVESPLPVVQRKHRGDIVLIIDDLGFEGQPIDRVMALDPNVNCSVLPNGTRASAVAEELSAHGFEVLCHLPMEPRGNEAPGRNAIMTWMSDEEIERTTREDIEAVPHARGVNNHMGSRATADRRVMRSVIEALPKGMYFIDSRTTGGSVAESVAREMGVRTAARNVFLDNIADERAIRKQLAELIGDAERHGFAIGIGHPHPTTLSVLEAEIPELRARGFRLVRASQAIR